MSLGLTPRPKPIRPIVAVFLSKDTQPRALTVHTATEEAAQWFVRECKEFGGIFAESPWTNLTSEGNFVLNIKLNYDPDDVAAYINAWRPTPKREFDPLIWEQCIETIERNKENHHDQ